MMSDRPRAATSTERRRRPAAVRSCYARPGADAGGLGARAGGRRAPGRHGVRRRRGGGAVDRAGEVDRLRAGHRRRGGHPVDAAGAGRADPAGGADRQLPRGRRDRRGVPRASRRTGRRGPRAPRRPDRGDPPSTGPTWCCRSTTATRGAGRAGTTPTTEPSGGPCSTPSATPPTPGCSATAARHGAACASPPSAAAPRRRTGRHHRRPSTPACGRSRATAPTSRTSAVTWPRPTSSSAVPPSFGRAPRRRAGRHLRAHRLAPLRLAGARTGSHAEGHDRVTCRVGRRR